MVQIQSEGHINQFSNNLSHYKFSAGCYLLTFLVQISFLAMVL